VKTVYRKVLLSFVFMLLAFSIGFAADKKPYSTSPPAQAAKKWRIGYYEGGPYKSYPVTLTAIVNSLAELGWIERITVPQHDEKDMSKLWAWLAVNVKSKYLEFVPDAFYSYNWKKENRDQTKQTVIRRLKETADIDLIIAMGTWAGKDLANNEHSVPVIVCSVSDAVAAKIIPGVEDSGFDHVHALVDPKRFERQIQAFHDIIGFKKLGISYIDTVDGRSYAAIDDIKKIAEKRNFEIIQCPVPAGGATPETNSKTVECAKTLASKIDAYYLTMQSSVNKETLPKIISAMNAAKIPVFSQSGSDEVRHGALLSIATSTDMAVYGKFHAEVIAKVINGAKPRDLDQVCEAPLKIAFNKATAKAIDLKDDVFQLLSKIAQEVYDKVEEIK
jgi:ABC-type uncharacterized transport system substrate-binding protein